MLNSWIWIFALVLPVTLSIAATCPDDCSCFGWDGEWIADCSRRTLSSVPKFDVDTTEIHLQYNKIETLQAGDFAGLTQLKHLYLQSNVITAIPDGLFDDLAELLTLRINDNRINDLGENKFSSLKKVQLLYAHRNRLQSVQQNAFNGMDSLKQISVAGNSDLHDLHLRAFDHNLTMIDISGSSVATLRSLQFSGNDFLEKLYLYDIDTLICDSDLTPFMRWMNLNPLTVFGRSTMKCAEPENLRGKSLLQVTSDNIVDPGKCPSECDCFSGVADCSKRGLPSTPIGFGSETTEIFLQYNNITRLRNNDLVHLSNLEHLLLHNNDITTWDVNVFAGISTTLKQLTLHSNALGSIPVGVFTGMRSLEILSLDHNLISVIRPNTFSELYSLVQLSLQNNQIMLLPDNAFANLMSLKYLGLANNRISSINESLVANSPDLYYFDISGNDLDVLPRVPSAVTRMVARDCRIKLLAKSSFEGATKLQILDVSNNNIYVFEEGAFAGATHLLQIDMSNNTMEEITDEAFSSATSLEVLVLRNNNNLKTVSQDAFLAQSKSLYRLYLENCRISYMSGKTLSVIQRSDLYVALSGNPWNCDCKLQDLATYIEANPSKTGDATCAEPKEVTGTAIHEVDYTSNCAVVVPTDDSLALVMSLSIVGAFLIIVVATGWIVWMSKNDQKTTVPGPANGNTYVRVGDVTSARDGEKETSEHHNKAYDDYNEISGSEGKTAF